MFSFNSAIHLFSSEGMFRASNLPDTRNRSPTAVLHFQYPLGMARLS